MKKLVVRVRVEIGEGCAIGPGKVALLEAIRDTGSLSQAARDLAMSYRRAWLLMDSLNSAFRERVMAASTGGKGGGGATVTAFGAAVIAAYRALEAEVTRTAIVRFSAIHPQAVLVPKSAIKPRRLQKPSRLRANTAPRASKTRRGGSRRAANLG